MACQARRMRLSASLEEEPNVAAKASFSVLMPEASMLPESSTDTMTLGAGSLAPAPGGVWSKAICADCTPLAAVNSNAAVANICNGKRFMARCPDFMVFSQSRNGGVADVG